MNWATPGNESLRIGISACLLGEAVRWDGGHKRNGFLTETMAPFVEWVSVCPEVEAGMSTPREPIHLEGELDGPLRLVGVGSGVDHTRAMERFSRGRAKVLLREGLDGYVFKRDSPTCGLHRVRLHREGKMPLRQGRGLYAQAITRAFPDMPVEEEGRLNDPGLRENFIERVFAWKRVRALWTERFSAGRLVAFHTAHKLQLLAHNEKTYRAMGRLVADARQHSAATMRTDYTAHFMGALSKLATRGSNTNVLQHAAGHLKEFLDSAARGELATEIHAYRRGEVPLVVPVTLLRHHVRVHSVDYLQGQTFLEPHPRELMLRNHV